MKPTWLVAHDFSAASDAAMMVAASDLGRLGGRLLLFHAYRLPPVASGLEAMANARGLQSWNRFSEKVAENAQRHLDEVARKLAKRFPELEIETRCDEGAPVPAILQVVDEAHVARVVVGHAAGHNLRRRLAGSVTEHIVKECKVPVLVVKGE
ncbi:MAG: universal stress protein [Deltaproteobacteria bacterium]|nr:MAG: universal stress protein [Deltaproteobacteria bacterium]